METNFLHVLCYPVIVNRKYIYGFSKSAPTPRHTILDSRLPPCNVISEGRPPLSNTSSEAGALPLEGRIENDSDQIFSKSKFVHCFLETTFLHVSCYPVIVNRKFIYGFSKSAPTPRYTILDTRLPPCNAISEGRPLLSNTSSEAGALPLEVHIENDWDQIFFKSKFVHSFLETTFLHVSCYPVIVKRKYIYGFSKSAPTPRYTILDSRLTPCKYVSRMTGTKYFSSQNLFIVFWKPLFSTFHLFMLPCHCKPKIYLRFFEVCTYPSIHNFGLEASPL